MMDIDRYLAGAKNCVDTAGQCDQCPIQEECHCEHWPRAFIEAVEQLKADRTKIIAEYKAQLEDRIGPGYHDEWNNAIRSMLYEILMMEPDKGDGDESTQM